MKTKINVTVLQAVQVGKDRLVNEISEIFYHNGETEEVQYYGEWNREVKDRLRQLGRILAMPDNSRQTLQALEDAGFINGEEDLYFG